MRESRAVYVTFSSAKRVDVLPCLTAGRHWIEALPPGPGFARIGDDFRDVAKVAEGKIVEAAGYAALAEHPDFDDRAREILRDRAREAREAATKRRRSLRLFERAAFRAALQKHSREEIRAAMRAVGWGTGE